MPLKLCQLQIYLSLNLHFKYLNISMLSTELTYQSTILRQLFLLTHFFCIIAKSRHLLQSGFISVTAWSVPIAHYCLACQLCHVWKRSEGSLV